DPGDRSTRQDTVGAPASSDSRWPEGEWARMPQRPQLRGRLGAQATSARSGCPLLLVCRHSKRSKDREEMLTVANDLAIAAFADTNLAQQLIPRRRHLELVQHRARGGGPEILDGE